MLEFTINRWHIKSVERKFHTLIYSHKSINCKQYMFHKQGAFRQHKFTWKLGFFCSEMLKFLSIFFEDSENTHSWVHSINRNEISWNFDLVGKCIDWKASNYHCMPLNFEPDDNYVQQMSFTLLESKKSRFKSFDSDVIRKCWSYYSLHQFEIKKKMICRTFHSIFGGKSDWKN